MPNTDKFVRSWIVEQSKQVLEEYTGGITIRQLYYRLVARGMTNSIHHYKRVVTAMVDARWDGLVDMEAFIDRERSMHGETAANEKFLEDEIELGKKQVHAWMNAYRLNRWSNQETFIEVWIEKKALQGVFERPCEELDVGLAPCKGYPSLSFLHEATLRFKEAVNNEKRVVVLYFGDYDPSGEDIPRSVQENISRMGCDIEVNRIALHQGLITELRLPSVPPKQTDSRTRNWEGSGSVELDAVEPKMLQKMCKDAILSYFDDDLYHDLKKKEEKERIIYQKDLKSFIKNMEF